MQEIKVLITGGGAPGIQGTLYSLRNNWDERKVKAICVDMNSDVVGKYLCDKFYTVPPGNDENFITEIFNVCEKEHVDVILPQVTNELEQLSRNIDKFKNEGTMVAISDANAIKLANNKLRLLEVAKSVGIPYPKYRVVTNFSSLEKAAEEFGFPFVVKPPEGSGMRGFRIIYDNIDRKPHFFGDKPDSSKITMEDLYRILGDEFPPLIAMEYLNGDEYTVDVLSSDQEVHVIIPRRRDKIRSGITFVGTVEKKEDIINYTEKLTREIGLKYAYGFQFKYSNGVAKLLESNPRIQGTMVLSTIAGANVIYGAVKIALGEELPQFRVKWNTRFFRYWGGVGIREGKVVLV